MRHRLWKSVENSAGPFEGQATTRGALPLAFHDEPGTGASLQPLRACSACAGDYEDPDRTAWFAELEEGENSEDLNAEDVDHDEFPAKET